jgi:hypothetical protein
MDGVIVDFDKGFSDLSGKKADSMPKKDFWMLFNSLTKGKVVEYWANLNWTPDGKQLWSYIKKYDPIILTAPPSAEAEVGKSKWVKKNIGSADIIFKQAKDKADYAKEYAVLIDDKESTIESWNKRGGIGILHKSASDSISQLKRIGL